MSQIRHKQFLAKNDILDAQFQANEPLLRAALQPRRILSPPNYLNPRHYGTIAAALFQLWLRPDFTGLSHTTGMLMSLLLMKYMVPTYFIEPEFAEAVAQTDPPEDFYLKDIKWPLPAMLFVLPDAFVQKYFGHYMPFLAVARAEAGTYPQEPFPKVEIDLSYASPLGIENSRILFHSPMFKANNEGPIDYTGNYPLDAPLSVISTGRFDNSIPFEESAYQLPPSLHFHDNYLSPEEDTALQLKVNSFAVRLMLALTARPEYVDARNTAARPEKVTQKKTLEALYHPNMLGTKFRVLRPRGPEGTGQGRPMPMHWHPGCWSHVAKGPRAEFLPISALPRTADGHVDWSSTPKETLERFWACHEFKWILPYLVNAPTDHEKEAAA